MKYKDLPEWAQREAMEILRRHYEGDEAAIAEYIAWKDELDDWGIEVDEEGERSLVF